MSYEDVYITKVTIEVQKDISEEQPTETTIAKLLSDKKDVDEANIKFTNAQVVYKDGNNYVIRENQQAINLTSTALNLDLGATLNGTVKVKVAYNSGFMKATDIDGVTISDNLTATGSTTEYLPITTTLADLSNYKGDLVQLEKVSLTQIDGKYYFTSGSNKYVAISNYSDLTLSGEGPFNVVALFESASIGYVVGSVKVIAVVELPQAPTIKGDTSFETSTTVTIESSVEGAEIYYTTDGSTPDPATSTKYTGPFTLTQTTTVKAIVVKDGVSSEVAEQTFTSPQTIADLHKAATSLASATIRLNDAKVVYADGNKNYIVRENGKALDILGSSLALKQGDKLSGVVTLAINYNYGILSSADISGTTNAEKLTITAGESTDRDPIDYCSSLNDVLNYPGDIVALENVTFNSNWFNDIYNARFYLSNYSDFGLTSGTAYDATVWYNEYRSGWYPYAKVIEASQHISSLSTPVISGQENFTTSTTVTITRKETVGTVTYTLDGTDPTNTTSKVYTYTEPFELKESATICAVATYKKVKSELASKTFTKVDLTTPKTIAELAELKMSLEGITLKLNNAQVVYAEGNNYIVREGEKAIDLLNTGLDLKQGQTLTGTVKLNVNYNNGILTTTDNETNADQLTVEGEEAADPLPLTCKVFDAYKYPGDLIKVENTYVYLNTDNNEYVVNDWGYDDDNQWVGRYVYFSNGAEKGLIENKMYNLVFWFNGFKDSYSLAKVIDAERSVTSMNQPYINNKENKEVFQGSTEITITLYDNEDIATIYYTLDDSDPKTSQTRLLYEKPFTINATTTVKAYAFYKDVESDVTSQTFTCVSPDEPKTIAEISAYKSSFDAITVHLVNAKVVYGEGNSYILRDYDGEKAYALDVLSTSLPLTVGATVTGTVKLKINYTDYWKGGILTTADITDTKKDQLTITAGENTLSSPLNVPLDEVLDHPGDLLTIQEAQGNCYEGDPKTYVFYEETYWTYLYISNGESYNIASNNKYDACIWYTGLTQGGAAEVKIIGLKDSYKYTLTDAGWGTLIVPFDCAKPSGTDWTIYESKGVNESGVLKLDEANCIKANTPYIVKGTAATSTLEGYAAIHEDTYTNGFMTGVYADNLTAPIGSYIMQKNDGVVAFYKVDEEFTLSPYRCYINKGASPSGVIRFPGDDTNGIGGIGTTNTDLVDVFTTTGMKVKSQVKQGEALDNLPAGIYIINNKKVIKK